MSDALDNAAAAALWMLALEQDPRLEHLGALYEDAGAIARTPTVTSGRDGEVSGRLRVPAGSLQALFHNHPSVADGDDRAAERFSRDDAETAKALDVPSYISTPSGAVRRLAPGKSLAGEEVLAEFPIDEFRAYLMRTLLERAPDDPRGLMR